MKVYFKSGTRAEGVQNRNGSAVSRRVMPCVRGRPIFVASKMKKRGTLAALLFDSIRRGHYSFGAKYPLRART